jgi:hypothetical protein
MNNAQRLAVIAADYLHQAQDADGKVDTLRRRRYKWLMKLAAKIGTVPELGQSGSKRSQGAGTST